MRYARWGAFSVWAMLSLATTIERVPLWRDEQALWQEASTISPAKPRVWNNLGRLAARNGDLPAAQAAYHTAIARAASLSRGSNERTLGTAIALTNLAAIHWDAGDHDGAKRLMDEAVAVAPHNPEVAGSAAWMHAQD